MRPSRHLGQGQRRGTPFYPGATFNPPSSPGPSGNLILIRGTPPVGMGWNGNTGQPTGTPGNISTVIPNFGSTTVDVANKTELDAALSTIPHLGRIRITADLTGWTGATNLPARGAGFRAQITGSNFAGLPAHESNYFNANKTNNRIDPSTHAGVLRKIVQNTVNTSIFRYDSGAEGWWLTGLDLTSASGTVQNNALVTVAGRTSHASLADMPSDCAIDRCYLHSWNDATNNVRRSIQMDGLRLLISGCYISIAHDPGGSESHGVASFQGGQDVLMYNCRVRGVGINVLLGGSGITITNPAEFNNQNYAFIRNHWDKDPTWSVLPCKNWWEIKNGVRILFWGNACNNNFPVAQAYAIVTNVANPLGTNPWSEVRDAIYWANDMQGLTGGTHDWAMVGSNPNPANIVRGTSNIEFAHNSAPEVLGGEAKNLILSAAFQGTGTLAPANGMTDHHNLYDHTSTFMSFNNPNNFGPSVNGHFSDNINRNNVSFGPFFADGGMVNEAIFNAIYGASWQCRNNWKRTSGWSTILNAAPHNNKFFVAEADIFTDPVNGDFTVKPGSAAEGTGIYGENPGPDWPMLSAAIAGVR